MFSEVDGDILDYINSHYICHQCNCKTIGNGAGLARTIFKKYPDANTYNNSHKRKLGHVDIIKPIINMYAQNDKGKPSKSKDDNYEMRKFYFKECLEDINEQLKDENVISLAFPKNIGCGLAGGKWNDYEEMLKHFEKKYEKINILIVDYGR